jgi:predicted nucleic acid-binding protein
MNVVDSSAWLEYLGDGPNAGHFAKAIENPAALIVPSLSLFEVFKRTTILCGETQALKAIALMMQGQVVELNSTLALEAARLSIAEHLPLADSVILATARSHHATLWTQDAHFEGLPDVEYRPKPMRAG